MAENKRIRVSTDTTPLQELRQQGEAVLQSFNQLEERFKNLAKDSTVLLREQIDLLKERNDLLSGSKLKATPVPEGIDQNQPETPSKVAIKPSIGSRLREFFGGQKQSEDSYRTLDGSDEVLKKILERTISIDQKLTGRQVVRENQNVEKKIETPNVPSIEKVSEQKEEDDLGGSGSILNSRLGRRIFSFASIAGIMAVVNRVGKYTREAVAYDVGQRTADSSYERRFAYLESGFMNTLTFGISSLIAQRERKELSQVEENIETSRLYSQLYNLSYNQAIAEQVRGYFGATNYRDIVEKGRQAAVEGGENPYGETAVSRFGNAVMASSAVAEKTYGRGTLASSAPGLISYYAGKLAGVEDETPVGKARKNFLEESFALPLEMRSNITETLGLSMTDYYKRIAELGKAGVRASNTREEDLYQMLIGQTIRGYSNEMMRQVLAVTRFGAQGTMTGTQVVQAMDTNLRQQGYDDQYIASTLDEYVNSFSRFAENILGKVGHIETDSMIQSMTSIQNATGTEGRQLERIQNALTGQSVSRDDVTQALLLRTARQMNPNLSMFDLEAMIEDMPNNINLQRNFLKTLQDMTGGGDMMKYTLQAVFPNLSKNDILAITEGRKDLSTIFDQGSVNAQKYNPAMAAEMIPEKEKTEAGTANTQLLNGLNNVFGKNGEKIDKIIEEIKQKRRVSVENVDSQTLEEIGSTIGTLIARQLASGIVLIDG